MRQFRIDLWTRSTDRSGVVIAEHSWDVRKACEARSKGPKNDNDSGSKCGSSFVIGNLGDYHVPRYEALLHLAAMRGDDVYLVGIFGKSSVYGFPQERRAQFFERESARSVTLIKDASDAGGHWVKVAVADGAPMKTAIAPSPTPDDGPAHPWLQRVGPGVVTGAADDESSSIVTYSRAEGGARP
jgi:hypothetical protein